jgi:hypothetical protein
MGPEGAGKSTVAEHLVTNHGYMELSFASALRESAIAMWNGIAAMNSAFPTLSIQDTLDREKKEASIGDLVLAGRPFSPRVLLQWFGTDIMRNHVADDVWVHATIQKMRTALEKGQRTFVFSDYRFSNEYVCIKQFLKDYDHSCQVVRIVPVKIDVHACRNSEGHPSTRGWITMEADREIVNPLQKESMESWLEETCAQILKSHVL